MILVKYILKEHIAPFLVALFVITFLFIVDFLVNILDSVLSKGLPLGTVLEIFALNLAWMLSLSIPMAVLVSCLMAFGRLSGDQEITVMKAAGISPLALMRPVLLVATLISLLLVFFNNWILPEANHRAVELMSAVSQKKPHAFVDAGSLITQFPEVQVWVSHIDPATGVLYGVQVFEEQRRGVPRIVYADSATLEYIDNGATLMFRLSSGENHILDPDDPSKYFRIRFSSQDFAMKNVNDRLERRNRDYRSDREMPIEMMLEVVNKSKKDYKEALDTYQSQLFGPLRLLNDVLQGDSIIPKDLSIQLKEDVFSSTPLVQRLKVQERSQLQIIERAHRRLNSEELIQAKYMVEVHKKFSTSVACFVFVLIGAPLGIMARKGGIGTGIVYSLAFFVIYWVSLIGGENLADRLVISPAIAMWSSNIAIGTFGLFISIKMMRDRYSGNSFFYKFRFLTRPFRYLIKRKKL